MLVINDDAGLLEATRETLRERLHPRRDLADALGAVPYRVHRRHHREQYLRGTDVTGGLVATNMLLARLQRHAQCRAAIDILRDTDDASGEVTLVGILGREKGGVRPAIAQWHTESLRVADGNVGAPLARRRQQREGKQVGRHSNQCTGRVRCVTHGTPVGNVAVGRGILQQAADSVRFESESCRISDLDLDATRFGARLHHRNRLRMARGINQEDRRPFVLHHRDGHRHRFRSGGAFIEQRRIRDGERGHVAHHRLEVQQCLEPPLRNLGLIRRVGRVPAGILEDVALDHWRREGAVVAHPDIGAEDLVLRRERAHRREHFVLTLAGRKLERVGHSDRRGDDSIDEGIESRVAERIEHRLHIRRRGADVPRYKRILHLSSKGDEAQWAPSHRSQRNSVIRDQVLVAGRVSQQGQIRGLGDLDLDQPSRAVAIGGDGLGRIGERFVDGDDLAGRRREEFAHGLHRLDHAERLPGLDRGANRGEFHEHDVANLLDGEGSDADGAVSGQPFVFDGVLEVFGDGHVDLLAQVARL